MMLTCSANIEVPIILLCQFFIDQLIAIKTMLVSAGCQKGRSVIIELCLAAAAVCATKYPLKETHL